MPDLPLIVAVDGGQTATKALVARADGTVLAAGRRGPSDHFHGPDGVAKNRRAIHGAIEAALAAAREAPAAVAAAGLGLTGAPTGGDQQPIVREIVGERLPDAVVEVLPDYRTNLAGASGGAPGVVVIAGGGAIGYGLTADGREALAGGYGYLLGDEGSAFDIGLRAIAAACRADDRRGGPTALLEAVCAHFAVPEVRQITRVVYRDGFSRERISLLAPAVVAAAAAGDAVAARILAGAAADLADTALGVVRQVFAPGDPVAVYPTGGVFAAGPPILGPFKAALAAGWPAAEVRAPRFPPAVGALIAARRLLDLPADEAWLATVGATLPAAGTL